MARSCPGSLHCTRSGVLKPEETAEVIALESRENWSIFGVTVLFSKPDGHYFARRDLLFSKDVLLGIELTLLQVYLVHLRALCDIPCIRGCRHFQPFRWISRQMQVP